MRTVTCGSSAFKIETFFCHYLDVVRNYYQLEFDGRSQLQISIDDSRIIQTEHHRIEDSFICKVIGWVQIKMGKGL